VAGLVAVGVAVAQVSGALDLSWNAITSGGGTSSGGTYVLTGAIGQPVAGGPSIGGSFAVTSGFLPGASQTQFRVFAPLLAKGP
jgi:hypothetical protein